MKDNIWAQLLTSAICHCERILYGTVICHFVLPNLTQQTTKYYLNISRTVSITIYHTQLR